MITEFARVLREKIRTDMNNYADDLAAGTCQTFDQYQKHCGVIHGLAIAEGYLLDRAKKVDESDE